mgnify:CR=1 FL=1
MPFPDMNMASVANAVDSILQANGNTASVTLNDGVTTFTVKTGMRKRVGENLTDGLQQENDRLLVLASRWDPEAGRAPEKGDQLTINGRRQAVEAVNSVGVGDTVWAYNLELRG